MLIVYIKKRYKVNTLITKAQLQNNYDFMTIKEKEKGLFSQPLDFVGVPGIPQACSPR